MGGWGQSQIKDHPSPSKARVGAELGNRETTRMKRQKNILSDREHLSKTLLNEINSLQRIGDSLSDSENHLGSKLTENIPN